MKNVYIVSACRTPIGRMGGALKDVSAVDLAALTLKEAMERAGVEASQVEHVVLGCVLQAALGQNMARQAALKAGLPVTSTAETLNVVCGSGLESVITAARMIECGEAEIVAAGGAENMSQAPFALKEDRFGYRMGYPMGKSNLIDTMVNDALWDAVNDYHMGITAENVAEQYGLSREALDAFSARSQEKTKIAVEKGAFKEEIVPVVVKNRKGDIIIDTDENPRPETTVESLAKLRPAFKPDGIVTAGNASAINDGAACVILASEEKVKELGLKPLARFEGGALGGVDPSVMGIGPVAAVRKVFKRLSLTIDHMDLIEANEAFAAQSLAVAKELAFPEDKLNVNGGAIALGHPVGASGCRILVTLLYAMKQRDAKKGLATLCIGGGMGCAVVVDRNGL